MRAGIAAGLFVAFLILYTASHSPLLGAAHDGVYYLRSIETGRHLFHPHHLLYNPAARLWITTIGFADTVFGVELLNALFGALTAALLFLLLARSTSMDRAFFWTALFGASFGPWFYSSTVEVYMMPLPFLLAALMVRADRGSRSGATIGALVALAALFHQTNLLFLPCALWRLRRSYKAMAAMLAAAALLVAVPYAAAYRTMTSEGSFAAWSTKYMHELDLGGFSPRTPVKAALGCGRFFIGGHFIFASGVDVGLAGHHLEDERFLVRAMDRSTASMLIAAAVFWFVAFAAALRAMRRDARPAREEALAGLLWFAPYAAFFSWWEPANVEFWIATMLGAIVALGAATAPKAAKALPAVNFLLPCALLFVNYAGSIRYLTNVENDWYLLKAKERLEENIVVPPELYEEWILGPYLERLSGRNR